MEDTTYTCGICGKVRTDAASNAPVNDYECGTSCPEHFIEQEDDGMVGFIEMNPAQPAYKA